MPRRRCGATSARTGRRRAARRRLRPSSRQRACPARRAPRAARGRRPRRRAGGCRRSRRRRRPFERRPASTTGSGKSSRTRVAGSTGGPDVLERLADREVGGDRGEDVPAVEGRARPGSIHVAVLEERGPRRCRRARSAAGQEQPVVRPDQDVAAGRPDADRPAIRAHARIDDRRRGRRSGATAPPTTGGRRRRGSRTSATAWLMSTICASARDRRASRRGRSPPPHRARSRSGSR